MKGIGFFLGATVGAFLLFAVISFLFLQPRKISTEELTKFLNNSDYKVLTFVPYVGRILSNDDERLGINILSKTTYFSNRNMSYVKGESYTYFSKEFNKYISTYIISEGTGMDSEFLSFGDKDKDRSIWPDIYAYYNKEQNADSTYGTIDKPLPILFFKSSNPSLRSMRPNNKDADPVYLKRIYEENVKLYLQYFIDKKDFKKLFPDK